MVAGGAGALLSSTVATAKVIAFADLGPEAVFELFVKDFPAIVAIDAKAARLRERLDA